MSEKNKYEQALELYNTTLDDAQVAAEVARIVNEKVPANDTPEVKKFLMGSIELTTLKTTDSDQSVMKFTQRVNDFDNDYPQLPHVATICVYPRFAAVVSDTLQVEGVEVACVSGSFPGSHRGEGGRDRPRTQGRSHRDRHGDERGRLPERRLRDCM